MDKTEALRLLGGSIASAARCVGVRPQAVYAWPNPLTPKLADRVQAALWRIANDIPHPAAPGVTEAATTDTT